MDCFPGLVAYRAYNRIEIFWPQRLVIETACTEGAASWRVRSPHRLLDIESKLDLFVFRENPFAARLNNQAVLSTFVNRVYPYLFFSG